jgi:hypothetical protein
VREASYRDVTRPQDHRPPPVILPSAQPLPFEAHLGRHDRQAHRVADAAPPPAPRSHHQPAMGLGGALIAMNRMNALEDAYRRRHRQQPLPPTRHTTIYGNEQPRPSAGGWGNFFVNSIRNLFGHSGRQQQDGDHHWTSYLDDPWGNHGFEEEVADYVGLFGDPPPPPKSAAPVYQPSFTHPNPVAPGYTYHFEEPESTDRAASSKIVIDVDNDTTSSSGPTSATAVPVLVCARCLDPLVLPGQDWTDAEMKARRIWSLRCSHMLDGKCIAALMSPASEPAGRSHGKATAALSPPAEVPHHVVDRKGKGKAVDRGEPGLAMQDPMAMQPEEDGSVRSRLRPRRNGAAVSRADVLAESQHDEDEENRDQSVGPARVVRPLPQRAKGRGRTRKRQERYRWKCPVEGCGHEHISVLPIGEEEYKMDLHKGAIALYV